MGGSKHCFCYPHKEAKRLEVNFYFFLTYSGQILCLGNPSDRHKWDFFSCSEFGERGRMNVNALVLSIKLIRSSLRLFLTVRDFLN